MMRRLASLAVLAALFLALGFGCSGGRLKSGVRMRRGEVPANWRPRKVVVLYPIVVPGSVERDVEFGTRPHMASEMIAVVHVNCRKQFERPGMPEWMDASEDKHKGRRLALLGTVIHQEYRKGGRPPERTVSELGRATGADAALVVEVFRYGPSRGRMILRNVSGEVEPVRGTESGAEGWLNCGVRITLVRCGGARVAWEASYLESRHKAPDLTQEMLARNCMERLMQEFPYRRIP